MMMYAIMMYASLHSSSYLDVPITLQQDKSGAAKPCDLLQLLQGPLFMQPSKLKAVSFISLTEVFL